jgi:hypothetical protein
MREVGHGADESTAGARLRQPATLGPAERILIEEENSDAEREGTPPLEATEAESMATSKVRNRVAVAVSVLAIIIAIALPSSYWDGCLLSREFPFGNHSPCPVKNDYLAWRLAIASCGMVLAYVIRLRSTSNSN